jgi:hypothetical protein
MSPVNNNIAWLMAYAAAMALVVVGMLYARQQALVVYGSEESQAQWNEWRAESQEMASGSGPVKRRPVESIEPPALVLMRDRFAICLTLAIVLSTVLFGTFMFFLRGALSSPTFHVGQKAPRT